MSSNFEFLRVQWPGVFAEADHAERLGVSDPRTSCFYSRRALELLVHWLYDADRTLRPPYKDDLNARLHEPTFKTLVGLGLLQKANLVRRKGNDAVHGNRPVRAQDAMTALRELFHLTFWLARTYGRGAGSRPAPAAEFDSARVPDPSTARAAARQQARLTRAQLERLEAEVIARDEQLAEQRNRSATAETEVERLRAEMDRVKAAAAQVKDTHDYGEAQTRVDLIDQLLAEAGWPLTDTRDREFEVTGMPTPTGKGYVDYVLWGEDGRPLAVIEAKRTGGSSIAGQQQAKLYADCLQHQFGQRPLIYFTNGLEYWFWDDLRYPPRPVNGFHRHHELALIVRRRATLRPLAKTAIDSAIVERDYQHRAIRRVTETFERDNQRKALLVMATGTGKTRTVIALAELLLRCNWVKRILFLADRTALVNQAVNAFKAHLPDSSPVNLVTDKTGHGRVYVSTYQTMMGLIEASKDTDRPLGVGFFDLVVIDEAHRSVYQKFRAIFDHFDSLLVGLTATPRDEIDRNTYSLFDIEDRVPTDSYDLNQAIEDGWLVPFTAIATPIRIPTTGLRYDDLTEDEKLQWDALEWTEDGDVPTEVRPDEVDTWLYNKQTVDLVLETVLKKGIRVAGGDRLGKTIIFAKNQNHASFIAERFDVNYPEHRGAFAQVITHQSAYPQAMIDDFAVKDKPPHIAISVDMLDTGIDIPEVVNLVFVKIVRSKTKFWQMIGRGTRLCPGLFGPDDDKSEFRIFDFGGNFEFFGHNLHAVEGTVTESLGQRLFRRRVSVLGALDQHLNTRTHLDGSGDPCHDAEHELRASIADHLHTLVAGMNPDNFIVRPKRRWVEPFQQRSEWNAVEAATLAEINEHLSGLPTSIQDNDEPAKRFDLLLLSIQLCVLNGQDFTCHRDTVRDIADGLLEQTAIPDIKAREPLLRAATEPEWWDGATLPLLERLRRDVRGLVRLLRSVRRKPVYTDFADELGPSVEHALPVAAAVDRKRFLAKVRVFLRAHEDHVAIQRLRRNQPLTAADLAELERMLVESGDIDRAQLATSAAEAEGFGLFVRSMVGLDRSAANEAISAFIGDKAMTSSQLEFVRLIIECLMRNGIIDPSRLYEAPFTDIAPTGPDVIFPAQKIELLINCLHEIKRRATVAS